MSIDLNALGFTQEELQNRVVEQIVGQLLSGRADEEDFADSEFADKLAKAATDMMEREINRIADEHLVPRVAEMIESVCLQRTNEWGEKKKEEPLTFREYLVKRAEAWLMEPVDFQGKTVERTSYGRADLTRVTYLVDKHLSYTIESAMKNAVEAANKSIVGGIAETVKLKLSEISRTLAVTVETR